MTARTKSFLIYVGGIVTGIILTFAFFFFVAANDTKDSNDNIVMFDEPQQEIMAKSFAIMQVLPDGNALAIVKDQSNFGMIVMFLAEEGTSYYDDQKIKVPTGKRVMQIGTYKYVTRTEMGKTVPIVEFVDK